ncbi:MAG: LPS-assembly protein LptD, partial [Candidatus Omnitrophica bacterium]|nr:LPS-assembly protein LptD [Candidatus Omnitrophota bacterium]
MIARLSFRWWMAGLLAAMLCVRAVPSAAAQPDLEARWVEVKALLARQAWREALAALDDILRTTPKDPNALAWRRLCQKRLSEGARFRVLSPREEQIVHDTLRQEQHAQARAAAARKALEGQLKREQVRWDAELERRHRQTVQEERARARIEQRQQRVARLPVAAPPVPPVTPPETPAPPAPSAPPTLAPSEPTVSPAPPSTQQSIELAPVTVTVAPPVPEVEEVTPVHIPSPEEVPPGAVQIFADQLIASTDRRLAVARGHVHVVFSDGVMTCEKATLFTDTKDIYAEGRVHLARGTEVFRGELVQYNTQTKKGRFLDATASSPPWHQHGQVIEHVAEGVLHLTPGYLTSCDLEPPHFRFQGRSSTVFADEKIVRGRNVTLAIEDFPLIYL